MASTWGMNRSRSSDKSSVSTNTMLGLVAEAARACPGGTRKSNWVLRSEWPDLNELPPLLNAATTAPTTITTTSTLTNGKRRRRVR